MSANSRKYSNPKVFLAYKYVKEIDQVSRKLQAFFNILNWACGTLGNELVSPVWQKLNMQMPSQKKLKIGKQKNLWPTKIV